MASAAGAALLYLFDPSSPGTYFPPCLFRLTTGLECAGCGVTRALHQLAHGNVRHALQLNPLLVLYLPFGAHAAASSAHALVRGRWLRPLDIRPRLIGVLIIAMLSFMVMRNLPWYPY